MSLSKTDQFNTQRPPLKAEKVGGVVDMEGKLMQVLLQTQEVQFVSRVMKCITAELK